MGKRFFLINAVTLTFALIPPLSPATASDVPKIEIVSPTINSKINLDAGFTLNLRFTGGWAKDANDCRLPIKVGLGAIDSLNRIRFWYDSSYQSGFSTILFKPKLISGGIECSYAPNKNAGNWNWNVGERSGEELAKFLSANEASQTDEPFGEIKQISFSWQLLDSSEAQNIKYEVNPSPETSLTFTGINRGDTIESPKKFTAQLTISKFIELRELQTNAFCKEPELKQENETTKTYLYDCIYDEFANTNSNGTTREINFRLLTKNHGEVKLNSIFVNLGDSIQAGKPIIDIYNKRATYGKNSKPLENTTVELGFDGEYFLQTTRSSKTPLSDQTIEICINKESECTKVVTDNAGKFTFSREIRGTTGNFEIKAKYRNYLLTENNLKDANRDFLSYFSSISGNWDVFKIPAMPLPEKPLVTNLIFKSSKPIPKNLKWGKNLPLSITTSGNGSAICEIYFQNPGWPSRKGVTSFKAEGGRTSNITIRPWLRIFAEYSLKLVCVPDGWPRVNSNEWISPFDKRIVSDLGRITIVP